MPSEKVLAAKKAEVEILSQKIKAAAAGVLVDYSGITVADDTEMRAKMRQAGVEYKVYKNTLISRACDDVGYGDMKKHLEGMSALAISESDPIAAAKILKEYSEKVETFDIKAGFLDGGVIDRGTVMELAEIPSREILVGKILGSLQSSLYGLAYALQAIIDKQGGAPEETAGAEVNAPEEAASEEAAPAEGAE